MKRERGVLGGGDVNEVVLVKLLTHQMKREHTAWKHAVFLRRRLCLFPPMKTPHLHLSAFPLIIPVFRKAAGPWR